jgi:hypothetical protein
MLGCFCGSRSLSAQLAMDASWRTSRHFAVLRDLVAIGAWRTSISLINQPGFEARPDPIRKVPGTK